MPTTARPSGRAEVEARSVPLCGDPRRGGASLRDRVQPDAGPDEIGRAAVAFSRGSSRRSWRGPTMLHGAKMTLRRGVAGALRRGGAEHAEAHFRELPGAARARSCPGTGPLVERYDAFRAGLRHSPRALDAVFEAGRSPKAASARGAHVTLPAGESFTVEYVTNKTWSGYNWYQGNYRSLIQVNTDLPIYIDRAIDLACHEGYPGPPRLQRAAREAPRARPRLDRVHGLSALLAAVAHRRGHRELRHRGRVPRSRARARSSRRCSFRSPASIPRAPRSTTASGARRPARLRRQRSGAALPRRRDRREGRRRRG